MKLGAIEAGGTKFVLGIGNEHGEIKDSLTIPTRTPEETIPEVVEYFTNHKIDALGLASFGPVDIRKTSPTYGTILNTPKLAWRNYPFLQTLKDALQVPVGFSTDVNAAALGEKSFGAGQDVETCLYITVGTGIGAGAVINGKLLEDISHPEMGHILVRRHPQDDFAGVCPYHGDCLEGLASGPAIEKRWGKKGVELTDKKEVWELEAYYLAQAIMHYALILVPGRIIIGGGVAKQKSLFPLIREQVKTLNNHYLAIHELDEDIEHYIVPPGLGDRAGLVGALVLAKQALHAAK